MQVSATDTEVSFVGSYKVDCVRPGSLTLGARQLFDIARLVPTDQVKFSLPEGSAQMEISSGKAFFKVIGLASKDFPSMPKASDGYSISMPSSSLKALVDKTLFAISSDDTRTGLNGAHIEVEKNNGSPHLRFVTTDGHRLAVCGQNFDAGEAALPDSVLLPKKGLSELRKLVEEGEGSWQVSFSQNQAVFQQEALSFSMRLLEGEFPDYSQVLPGDWQRRVLVSRDALMLALRRVSILASEKSHPVKFVIQDGSLTIQARQPETGEASEEVEAQVEGGDLEVGFNARYFLDVLSAMASDTVSIEIGDSLSPCLLKPGEGDADELYVIMPMRLE